MIGAIIAAVALLGGGCDPGIILCESSNDFGPVRGTRLLFEIALLFAVLISLFGTVFLLGTASDRVGYRAKAGRLALAAACGILAFGLAGRLIGGSWY